MIQYDLSAAGLLRILGFDQRAGRTFLEQLKQDKQIPLPSVYVEFMELAYQCPLFATSNLWTGASTPWMYYDEIREYVDDLKAHQEDQPVSSRNRYFPFIQTPREEWPGLTGDYLLIDSDFGGGEITFGIRKEDLDQDDPPVYWHHERDPIARWREDKQSLSGFLLENLWNVLNNVGYDTAERVLEKMGWRIEEYFAPPKRAMSII